MRLERGSTIYTARGTAMAATGRLLMVAAGLGLFPACGGTTPAAGKKLLPDLRQAIASPVDSREQREEHSRLVEKVADSDVLEGMTRDEVAQAIGRGDDCSRHPRCAENDFKGNDWFYTVGRVGSGGDAGPLPILIVGFDRFGQVQRTWNLRVH